MKAPLLNHLENLKLLVNKFNNVSLEDNIDFENVIQSKIQNMKIPNKDKSLALIHINACSLNKNFDNF